LHRFFGSVGLIFAASSLVGCTDADPTWHQDVAPIVAENCAGCHTDGKIAPFTLDTYAQVAPIADWLATTTEAGTMPPWGAQDTDECDPPAAWKHDRRLTEDQIATLRAWADAGAPEGDPATAADLPNPVVDKLTGETRNLEPEAAYVTSGTEDEFICFVLDPGNDAPDWMTGLQVNPGNQQVVHHALIFTDATAASADLADEDGKFECFGSPGIGEYELVGAWAPGAAPMETPTGAAMLLAADGLLVMQIHYHPVGEVADPDVTTIDIRTQPTFPGTRATMALVGNARNANQGLMAGPNDAGDEPEFRIPAGARGHTETIRIPVDDTYPVWAAGTHMHYVGTDMKISLEKPDGSEQCLVQTPAWDFNWQRWYDYDAPLADVPTIEPGDTLVLRCTYDNSLDNPFVREALQQQGMDAPADVLLGDETLDEMCLGVFGVAIEL